MNAEEAKMVIQAMPEIIWKMMSYSEEEAIKIAFEALEKQIELEPMYNWGITYCCPPDCGGKEFDEYEWIPSCPRCTRVIDNFTTRCECGQAIKRNKTYPKERMD